MGVLGVDAVRALLDNSVPAIAVNDEEAKKLQAQVRDEDGLSKRLLRMDCLFIICTCFPVSMPLEVWILILNNEHTAHIHKQSYSHWSPS